MSSEVLRDPLLVKDSTGILSHCTVRSCVTPSPPPATTEQSGLEKRPLEIISTSERNKLCCSLAGNFIKIQSNQAAASLHSPYPCSWALVPL